MKKDVTLTLHIPKSLYGDLCRIQKALAELPAYAEKPPSRNSICTVMLSRGLIALKGEIAAHAQSSEE